MAFYEYEKRGEGKERAGVENELGEFAYKSHLAKKLWWWWWWWKSEIDIILIGGISQDSNLP